MNSFKLNKKSDKQIENPRNSQSGIAMVMVMIMISLLVVAGITMNRRSGIKSSGSPNHLKKHEATCIAEAGVQHTIYELMIDPLKRGSIFTGEQFSSGSYSTEALQPDGILGDIIITSTGEIRKDDGTIIARKTIQMRMTPIGNILAFRAVADTYLDRANHSLNYGGETTLFIGKDQSNNYYRGLLRFDLSEILPGSIDTLGVYAAYIELYMDSYTGIGMPSIDIHRVTRSWAEGPGGNMRPAGATWETYDGDREWNTHGGDYDTRVESFSTIQEVSKIWYRWSLPDISLIRGWVDDPSSNFGIIMKDSTEDKWVVADAVKFKAITMPPVSTDERIVDNSDPGFSITEGTWRMSTGYPDYYGSSFRYNEPGTGPGTVTWEADLILGAGSYEVFVWYPISTGFAARVPFTVYYSGSSKTVLVDQSKNGGQWVSIGTYAFSDDGTENVTMNVSELYGQFLSSESADINLWPKLVILTR